MSHENYTGREITEGSSDRSFGLVFSMLFFGIAFAPLLSGAAPRFWSAAVGSVLLLISMLTPSWLAWPNRVWSLFGKLLHRIVSPILLAALFFVLITPYAVILRIFRKDQLGLAREPEADSYWRKRSEQIQSMKRQF
jgi:hypothetical protein